MEIIQLFYSYFSRDSPHKAGVNISTKRSLTIKHFSCTFCLIKKYQKIMARLKRVGIILIPLKENKLVPISLGLRQIFFLNTPLRYFCFLTGRAHDSGRHGRSRA